MEGDEHYAVFLYHQLVLAYHSLKGNTYETINFSRLHNQLSEENSIIKDIYKLPLGLELLEEARAIGLGRFKKQGKFSENLFRKECGLPIREYYTVGPFKIIEDIIEVTLEMNDEKDRQPMHFFWKEFWQETEFDSSPKSVMSFLSSN